MPPHVVLQRERIRVLKDKSSIRVIIHKHKFLANFFSPWKRQQDDHILNLFIGSSFPLSTFVNLFFLFQPLQIKVGGEMQKIIIRYIVCLLIFFCSQRFIFFYCYYYCSSIVSV